MLGPGTHIPPPLEARYRATWGQFPAVRRGLFAGPREVEGTQIAWTIYLPFTPPPDHYRRSVSVYGPYVQPIVRRESSLRLHFDPQGTGRA